MLRPVAPLLLILFATMVMLPACGDKNNNAAASKDKGKGGGGNRQDTITAEVYVVKPVAYAPVYTASGQLMATEMIDIHPEVSGRVTSIFFSEGSKVRKGQLLLQLNDADVKAQVAKLQAQRSLQQSTQRRYAELLRIGGISKQEYEATQTDVKGVEADIAVSQANLARLRIIAPFDGTIGLRNVSAGAIVSPATSIATLQQTVQLKMDFNIPDQYRKQLSLGQEVRFFVDGRLDTMAGKIAAIEPGADASTHTVRTRAIVQNSDGRLLPGSFAHVLIPFGAQSTSILIPSQSIIPTTKDKKVALVRNRKAVMQTVQTGDRTEDRVQITAGLKIGDTILTTALMQVKQDKVIRIRKAK